MANNLRYLLEHFCLDGQVIDISSKLDEENADKIEKINTETVPTINSRIDGIKNTDIPNINSRIDGIKNTDIPRINSKIESINEVSIPTLERRITGVDDKVDSTNVKVEKNSKDIASLSDNVTNQGNAIESINTETIPNLEKTISDNDTSINQKVDTLVQGLGDSINSIQKYSIPMIEADIETANKNIVDNTTKISGLETDLTTLRDTTVDGLSKSVDGLTTKVNTNIEGIATINNTSIPNLQSQIDDINTPNSWKLIKEVNLIGNFNTTFSLKLYSNNSINFLRITCDFKDVTDPQIGVNYGVTTDEITTPFTGMSFNNSVEYFGKLVGLASIINLSTSGTSSIALMLNTLPNFSGSLDTVNTGIFYF